MSRGSDLGGLQQKRCGNRTRPQALNDRAERRGTRTSRSSITFVLHAKVDHMRWIEAVLTIICVVVIKAVTYRNLDHVNCKHKCAYH